MLIQRKVVKDYSKGQALKVGKEVNELPPLQAALLPGYVPAIASSFNKGPITGTQKYLQQIAAGDARVLLIWVGSASWLFDHSAHPKLVSTGNCGRYGPV